MNRFELAEPTSLKEAVSLLDPQDETVRALSGGTALMLMMKAGVFEPSKLISLQRVDAGQSAIEALPEGGFCIGALATLASVENHPLMARHLPFLPRAMKHLSNVRVRNVARIGGALAHGDPHMDLPPMLAALHAKVSLLGPSGSREVAVAELYTGYYETVIGRDELIASVLIPSQAGRHAAYVKCTTRSVHDWPAAGVAVTLQLRDGIIAAASVVASAAIEKVTRLVAAESELLGQAASDAAFRRAADAGAAEVECVPSVTGSAEYKQELLRVYIRRALHAAITDGAMS